MFKHEKGVLLYTNFQLLAYVGKIANSQSWYLEKHPFLMPEPAEKIHFNVTYFNVLLLSWHLSLSAGG